MEGGHYSSSSHYVQAIPTIHSAKSSCHTNRIKNITREHCLIYQMYIMQAQYANCLQKTYYFWMELQYSEVFQQKKKALMDQAFV